jgi:hypothetical protein
LVRLLELPLLLLSAEAGRWLMTKPAPVMAALKGLNLRGPPGSGTHALKCPQGSAPTPPSPEAPAAISFPSSSSTTAAVIVVVVVVVVAVGAVIDEACCGEPTSSSPGR